jgi:lipopolysaccharide export system permease protein
VARANIYLTDGTNILTAANISGLAGDIEMTGVTWYARTPTGVIREQIRSPRATYAAPGWRLETPVRFDVASATATSLESLVVGETLTPERIDLQAVDADALGFWQLRQTIEAFEAAGRRTAELRAKWWHRLAGPLSALLMPLLGAVAAFGLARSGQLFVRALIGMALGFAYFVVDNAALAMGNFGGYPPFLAAWAPFLLFLLVGETVLIRTEE